MIKVPNLFERDDKFLAIPTITPGCEWVLEGVGEMTFMLDGQCIKVEGFGTSRKYSRRVRKNGEIMWFELKKDDPNDEYLLEAVAFDKYGQEGIYEAIGPKINGNPHNVPKHAMYRVFPVDYRLVVKTGHTIKRAGGVTAPVLFEMLKFEFLDPATDVEGVVFHKERFVAGRYETVACAKVRKKDFGIPWPVTADAPLPQAHVCKWEDHTNTEEICMGCGATQYKQPYAWGYGNGVFGFH